MAYTMTVLGWGGIEWESAYEKAGELENLKKALKWGTDYFIKVWF
jgi:endoglucanase